MAAVCPIRKKLIKENSKIIRQRNRSQSRSASRQRTYAEAAATKQKSIQVEVQQPQPTVSLPGNFHAVITSAITFLLLMEAAQPWAFQRKIDEMHKLNNIPLVKFPKYIGTAGLLEAFSGMQK